MQISLVGFGSYVEDPWLKVGSGSFSHLVVRVAEKKGFIKCFKGDLTELTEDPQKIHESIARRAMK